MKPLAKILALYIIGLAIYPCADSLHQHFMQEKDQVCDMEKHERHSDDHQDEKPHSPLCSCKCHHQHTTVKEPLKHLAVERHSVKLAIQDTQLPLNYNPSLFHPPIG